MGFDALPLVVENAVISGSMTLWVGGLALAVLLTLSAFFSSSEIAMFSLPNHRVEPLVEEGRRGARSLKQLKDDPHRLLMTILVGNNIVNVAMSSLATGLLAYYGFQQGTAVAIATFGVTAVVLLFGEAAPKSYAVENAESWALRIARPLRASGYVLSPLVITFDYLTRLVNKVTGGRTAVEDSYITRSEIKDVITTGERAGVIEEDEREMLQRILRFNNTIAKEIMTPRLDMTAVSIDAPLEEALTTCVQDSHTRLPVYEGSLDNVVGVVSVDDLVREHVYGERDDLSLQDLLEPTLHVPESKNADELLTEMREQRVPMVIVIDEFGTTEGLITMEDMVEEIVGEILEGEETQPIVRIDENEVLVQGEVNIEDANEAIGVQLPEGEEFETIAGFVFNRAGRLVEEGEEITYDSVALRVEDVENTRIKEVRVRKTDDLVEEGEEIHGNDRGSA